MELEDSFSITPDDYTKLQKQMLKLQEENNILKKAITIFAKKVDDTEITNFINQETENHTIQKMCDVLDIPRSTYYDSLDKTVSNRDQENHELTERIIEIHNESKHRYRGPKIHYILREEVNHVQYID